MTIRLDSLTIRAFRGIRYEEQFDFGGRNAVVVGPNGAGKSTVLQAVEFLLTGQISALRGSGTGGIRATEHVPNQYADPNETAVKATFRTDDSGPFRVVREFSNRSRLQADDRPEAFRDLMTVAEQGLLYLSRDELLELIIATPGNRKDQIYQLMDTEGLDGRRKQLKRLAKNARREASTRATRYEENLRKLKRIAGEDVVTSIDGDQELEPVALRQAVNVRRERLGGDPIETLDAVESFQTGVTSPLNQASNPLHREDVQQHISDLQSWLDGESTAVAETLAELRQELGSLRADEDALDSIAARSIVQQGLDIVDPDTRTCPLCSEPWDPDELHDHLEQRADRLERIESRIDQLDTLAGDARQSLSTITTAIDRLVDAIDDDAVDIDFGPLVAYRNSIDDLSEALSNDFSDDPEAIALDTLTLPASEDLREAVDELRRSVDALPDRSALETTWSELESLTETYSALQISGEERSQYAKTADELEAAHDTFLRVRDDVLEDTYESINDRFAEFYEAINPDESSFNPALGQTDTGVEFSVEFYETGDHPPNALHSEGHQDLMGTCLFLALATELSPLETVPVLLDDVVMSVDREHRKHLASVLRDDLSEHFQFVVAAHDSTWARQLVDGGVVREADVIRFTKWTPERGPVIEKGLR